MQHPEAFSDAVKEVDAIIHTTSVMTFSSRPSEVVAPGVQGTTAIMRAACRESSVKRFVYTSSSTAVTIPKPGQKFKIDKNLWNDEVDKYVDIEGDAGPENAYNFYAVSKLRAERAVWDFVQSNNPLFTVNCILPDANFGRVLDSPGVTGNWVVETLRGKAPRDAVPPQYMVDVIDDARLHLISAIDKTVANERIFAFDTPFNWNELIYVSSELRPDAKLPDKDASEEHDLSEVDNALGASLLKKWYGQDGYKGLRQSVEENLEGV